MSRLLRHLKSIKGKIILFFFIYIFLFLSIFGFGGYQVFSNIFMNNIFSYTNKLVMETGRNIDSYLGQINMICSSAATNEIILAHLDVMKKDKTSAEENLWKVEYYLQDLVKFNSKIRDIILIDKNGHSIAASGKGVVPSFNFFEQTWYPRAGREKSIIFTGMHHQNYYYENYGGSNETVSAVIPVYNFLNMDWVYGESIICNLNIYELFDALRNITLEKNGQIILLDGSGRSIFRNNYTPHYLNEIENLKNEITKSHKPFFTIIDGRETAVVHTISRISGWTVVAIIPKDELLSHITPLKHIFAIIAAFLLFMLSVSYGFMSRLITKPIENILEAMEKIEKGNFDITVNENETTETRLLSSKINSLVTNVVTLNRKIYSFQLQNKEAQIKALQAQVNPHFLFNTLQLLKSSAILEGNKETGQIITSLGNILRYGIYHQEELVSLKDELNHLGDYLDIQSRRFPSLISCAIECPEELLNRKTIKLILQPVVENSINHNKRNMQTIDIRIKIANADNKLLISIADNGNGVDGERLEEIRNYIRDSSMEDRGESIGLKNVHNRIVLKFGTPFGATIYSKEGKGFKVELLLPDILYTGNEI